MACQGCLFPGDLTIEHNDDCKAWPKAWNNKSITSKSITSIDVGGAVAPPITITGRGPVRCQNCGVREGTEVWTESSIAYVHGIYSMWCKRCTIEKRLAYAKEQAAQIPELERQIMILDMSGQS